VTGDELGHSHWGNRPGKGPGEDDPEVRRPDHARLTQYTRAGLARQKVEAMKRTMTLMAALVSSAAAVGACSGDDTVGSVDAGGIATDATPLDSTTPDAATLDATGDGSAAPDADADAAPPPTRILLSFNGSSTSELAAFGVVSKHVDGDLIYPGSLGTTSTASPSPYLLEQKSDVVARLDGQQPWVIDSSWNVALNDAVDGGDSYSDPQAVVVTAGTKAYVLRYTRNEIAVIDPSQIVDGGAPTKSIDLSSMVQAADEDGHVEMTAGAYLPSTGILYVLLGNIDLFDVAADGYTQLCANTKATIIGIDTTTDMPVMLPGGNASGAIELGGYDPQFGGGLTYDAANGRFVILEDGCNTPEPDAGAGPIELRRIEAVSLATGAVTKLLDADAMGFPGNFTYVDATHAFVQFSAPDFSSTSTYAWDPTQTTIGATVMNAPDSWVYDGAGNLLGVTTVYATDGGSELDVVSVRASDGTLTTLGVNPFTLTSGYLGGVDIWPHP
jgi:hypothetical protein